jgi:hypothetical protein
VYVTCYLLPLLLLSNASTLDATDCDMINGGWELVMRFAPQSTFVWDSPYWTNNLTFGDTQTLSPDSSTDAKFPSMLYTNVHEIRGCLGTGLTSSNCKNYSDFGSGGYSSTQNIFASVPVGTPAQGALTFQETDAEMQGWLAIAGVVCNASTGMTQANSCNWKLAGINLDDTTSQFNARVRFGIMREWRYMLLQHLLEIVLSLLILP